MKGSNGMKKKLTSILTVALVAAFLLPATHLNTKANNHNVPNTGITILSIDPPSVTC